MTQFNDLAFSRESLFAAAERLKAKRNTKASAAELESFLEQYRADAFIEDFLSLTVDDAATLALDLWDFNRETEMLTSRSIRTRRATGAGGRTLKLDVAEIAGSDIAFLVDSAIGACQEAKVEILAVLHPIIQGPKGKRSIIQIHLPTLDDDTRADLQKKLEDAFLDVAVVNADFLAMRAKMEEASSRLADLKATQGRTSGEITEARAFLSWLTAENFTYLGARDYTFAMDADGRLTNEEPIVDEASGLGILRDPARNVLSRGAEPAMLTSTIQGFIHEASPVIVAKASFISRVHRRNYADYVGVKRYDERGDVIGETRFVGMFTSEAYTRAADEVPLIRRKIETVKAAAPQGSRFSLKQLDTVLKTYPRDELFQISEADLERISAGVVRLLLRPRTSLFIRRDRFDRYVSALLYTPRDSYNSDLRTRAHKLLAEAYGGRPTAFYPSFGDGPLARVHLIIGVDRGHPEPDEDSLDLQLRQLFETWEDALERVARSTNSDTTLSARARFTGAYKEAFQPEEGLADILAIGALQAGKALRVRVWGPEFEAGISHVKIYHRDEPLDLAEIVPVLERMGLRVRAEVGYPIRLAADEEHEAGLVYVHDLTIDRPGGQHRLDARFEQAFEAIWARETENDRFNSLVVALGTDWRSAALLRTLSRYRSQSGLDPSEPVQVRALTDHPEIANNLLSLFAIKFDPAVKGDIEQRRKNAAPVIASIQKQLESVATLDADRALRRLLTLINATQRTNFYLRDGAGKPSRHIAVKIASREADPLPAPRPYREIFVWSPDVEGVHLRFGPVARGGLRWSDRRDDFRTEVLGLVKAQQVKNAVIVPVGSKGGFYPKTLPAKGAREEIQAAGVAAYKTFVGALLQITDNIVDGKTVHPPGVVIWDGEDPYLVVAADKGTATFSDIANGLAADYKFWLGDAFASGGSVGYDHKKMGITARGAWEAVKRHFREMGRDTQSQPFSVIGIGDMSGDVFGNGMMLSKFIQLKAAFDHRHIFLDPNPTDLEATFNERKRMFDLPRSSWADYDQKLISKGGGIFERAAKSIKLTPEIKTLSGLSEDEVTPDALIKALLTTDIDLLWFGGIGAYIKASTQSHADVGDKTNDILRVDAKDVRAKVIAEGANLGVTQAGRIEFARTGGRINTDAIDNSAGVDSSDHEVNIKILTAEAINEGALKEKDRNALLASMTDEVGLLVLENNYDQTGALSVMQATAPADLDSHEGMIETLERQGKLDRVVEGLPSPESFRKLREQHFGLTRPELAVVMAYAKLDFFSSLIASKAPDDPAFEKLLIGYFPKELEKFGEARRRHRLRREIIATRLANRIVNMTGPSFPIQKRDAEGIDAGHIAQAFEAAFLAFHIDDLVDRTNALDGKASAAAQTMMSVETSANLRMLASAFASEPELLRSGSITKLVERYRAAVTELKALLPSALSPLVMSRVKARAEKYRAAGAPDELAQDVATVRALASARETVEIADQTKWPLAAALYVQHQLGEQLGFDRMRAAVRDLDPREHWDRLALQRISDDLPRRQSELTIAAIRAAQKGDVGPAKIDREAARKIVSDWIAPRQALADRFMQPMRAFDSQGGWSLAKLVLLGDAVREFIYAYRTESGA
ncbi:MAG TPA: NAD-glutamate dehydrogenase [Hyphomonadaceae bacterium]|nr:NAD-glutamate dehydrogenase [Hyphomonadaceae bacterium]HPN04683.1 NAD-glutamate dehydrogenase [Hyphomonadaceae bacterium]